MADPNRPIRPGVAGVVVVGVLVMAVWWGLRTRALVEQARYREVTAKVQSARLQPGAFPRPTHNCSTADGRGPRQVFVTYSYDADGVPYVARAWDVENDGQLFCDEASARSRLAELQQKGTVTAYYDPRKPERAVLSKQSLGEVVVVWLMILAAGAASIAFLRRSIAKTRAYERLHDVV